ncbi:MAG TPA: OsmC family protein [Anseongella sp.]
MAKVTACNGKENYLVEIGSPTGNKVIADEPVDKGGKDNGFSPKELLASALATCTNVTVRMFADRKEWDVQNVQVEIELVEEESKTTFQRSVTFKGNLDDTQRKRLLAVANACPIHKILTHEIAVETIMK